MMELTVLAADHGDCLLVKYQGADSKVKNILIDGGTRQTYTRGPFDGPLKSLLRDLSKKKEDIVLWVITHIDDDHIGGVLGYVNDRQKPEVPVHKIWFNSGRVIARYLESDIDKKRDVGIEHFDSTDTSVRQGKMLEDYLEGANLSNTDPIVVPKVFANDDYKITILSPNREALIRLDKHWQTETYSSDTSGSKTDYHSSLDELSSRDDKDEDTGIVNGSSIGMLLEIKNKKLLLLADAHAADVLEQLNKISPSKPIAFDAVKLSHHGSFRNTSLELLKKIECKKFIISSDGLRHGLPNKLTIARILQVHPEASIFCNYDLCNRIFLKEDNLRFPNALIFLNNQSLTL